MTQLTANHLHPFLSATELFFVKLNGAPFEISNCSCTLQAFAAQLRHILRVASFIAVTAGEIAPEII